MTNLAIEDLRLRYDKEWDIKDTLEDKAKNIISTAGTITSLVFGFVTFASFVFEFSFPFSFGLVVLGSIIASILSILISILALRLQDYCAVWDLGNLKAIQLQLQKAEDTQLIEGLIERYINCILFNAMENKNKGKRVQWATNVLFGSIVMIGVATGMTLFLLQNTSASTFIIPEGASVQGNPSYEPNPITVKRGATISVENKDSFIHTVTSGMGIDDSNMGKLFDTGIIKPGESTEVVVAELKSGQYPFLCTVHPYMKGTLKLIESEATYNQSSGGKELLGNQSSFRE